MKNKERAVKFLKGENVDKIPFHPLIMQFASVKAGVKFSDYCTNYKK